MLVNRYLDWTESLKPNWVGFVLFFVFVTIVTAVLVLLLAVLCAFVELAFVTNPAMTLTTSIAIPVVVVLYALYLAIFKQGENK
jgi:hypothetical protein